MTQLAFEPAFDSYHTAFRLLRQIEFRSLAEVQISRLKILDVYVSEPQRCLEIRLGGPLKKKARQAAKCQMPIYGKRPSSITLFNQMRHIQDAAIQTFVLQGILDPDAYRVGAALRTNEKISADLSERISVANEKQSDLMTFLCVDLDEIPFDGVGGVKDRTSLGEYRYDLI